MNTYTSVQNKTGFTIVELVVAIAVLAILVIISITAYGNARDQARFSEITTEMQTMKAALEEYYAENGAYPIVRDGLYFTKRAYEGNNFIPGLIPDYHEGDLPDIEYGDKSSRLDNTYAYKSNGRDYKLLRVSEQGKSIPKYEFESVPEDMRDPLGWRADSQRSWGYWTPGAVNW